MADQRTTVWRLLVVTAMAIGLGACAADMDDLRTYVDEVKARPGGIIAPLPRVVPAPSFTYVAGDRRSPFLPETPQGLGRNNPDAIQGRGSHCCLLTTCEFTTRIGPAWSTCSAVGETQSKRASK